MENIASHHVMSEMAMRDPGELNSLPVSPTDILAKLLSCSSSLSVAEVCLDDWDSGPEFPAMISTETCK